MSCSKPGPINIHDFRITTFSETLITSLTTSLTTRYKTIETALKIYSDCFNSISTCTTFSSLEILNTAAKNQLNTISTTLAEMQEIIDTLDVTVLTALAMQVPFWAERVGWSEENMRKVVEEEVGMWVGVLENVRNGFPVELVKVGLDNCAAIRYDEITAAEGLLQLQHSG